jgi:hypothetical protein
MNEKDVRVEGNSAVPQDSQGAHGYSVGKEEGSVRSCTCHPDDRSPVCQRKYAANACQQAYMSENNAQLTAEVIRLREALETILHLSDSAMEDGDGARDIAEEALCGGKLD